MRSPAKGDRLSTLRLIMHHSRTEQSQPVSLEDDVFIFIRIPSYFRACKSYLILWVFGSESNNVHTENTTAHFVCVCVFSGALVSTLSLVAAVK